MAVSSSGVLIADGVRVDGGAALLASDGDSDSLVGVTSLNGGAYAVHWVIDTDGDGEPDGLAVQRFAADGSKQGGVTILQGISADLLSSVSDEVSYDLQALENGGYVLTYGLTGGEETESQVTVTASAAGQTLSVPLIGRPTEFYVGSAPANATFQLTGFDNNGARITVALTPVDGQISITTAILDQFGNDNRLTLQIQSLNQGQSATIYASTKPEWTYDLTTDLTEVATSVVVGSGGVAGIALGEGRAEAFHVDAASYANGTGPTFALLQITTNAYLDLFNVPGAVRLSNGTVQIPVTADAGGTYRVPTAVLVQLGENDAQTVLVLGGLTAGSTLSATIGNRPPIVIPEGVFVQAFNANGVALNADGVRVDNGATLLASDEDSEGLVGVTSLDGGAYVVHWVIDTDGDGEADGLAVQRFAADGTKQGGVTILQGISSDLLESVSDDVSYDLQALDNGGYVLTYGLNGGEEYSNSVSLTASGAGQTLSVPLIGRPTDIVIAFAPAGATFQLSGFDNNGARITVALTPVDGQISITSAILNQFGNDNRLTLQVRGLNQGEGVTVYTNTKAEWTYDLSAALTNVTTDSVVGSGGVVGVALGEGRAEAFHVDAATYANGTGPTLALLQITTNAYLDLFNVPGAVRFPNGVIQIPVTADASGTYRVPASILAQLGTSDAQAVLVLGGLTVGSTLSTTIGSRPPIVIPDGVFVQAFNANGVALNANGVRVDSGAAMLADTEDSERVVGVTSLDGGAYVVHWVTDIDGDGEPDGLAVQRFAADGSKQGGITILKGISADLLNSVSDDVSYDLQALENGGYVLTYGLSGGEESANQVTLTASAAGQTISVPLIGRPTEFYVGSAPAGAIFQLSGFDNNGVRITVALTPVDGLITITSAILDRFINDNRLALQVQGLDQGASVTVYIETKQDLTYDLSAPLDIAVTQTTANFAGFGVVRAAEGRAETFHVDTVTYANGTGPTSAMLQIVTGSPLDLFNLPGAVRFSSGIVQVPVTADATGTYRLPASIAAQLGASDAQILLILGGLTAGSALVATVGARDAIPIPEGVFVQTFNANGVASLTVTGTNGADVLVGGNGDDRIDGGAGIDVAVYDISRAQAVVQNTDGMLTINAGVQGTDRLTGVEQVQFSDGLFSFQFKNAGGILVSNFAVGAGGWSSQELYPRHVADVNGDGFSDIVGFGQAGILVSFGAANGSFSAPVLAVRNFGQEAGWSSDNLFHRELVDVNGDGRADVIGFGAAGALVSLANADGTFSVPALGIANFGTAQGWATQEGYARVTGDVNGDGKADLIGFGTAGTLVSLGNGDGTFQAVKFGIADFGVQQGWTSDNSFHRTVADVNGDGKDDIIGFGTAGALVALSKGDGTFETVTFAASDFGRNQGWSSQNSFARYTADVNGDGFADIVGFGLAGTYVAYAKANGTFSAASLDALNFGANQGWASDNIYHRELADIDNDGRIDIVGFGQAGVLAGLNQGYWQV